MTTPIGQYTCGRIITYAYQDCGMVQEGSVPNSEQMARGWMRLQDMVNFWVTQGLKLFLTTDLAIPLVQGQNPYVLGPGGNVPMVKPLQVDSAYFLSAQNVSLPLIPLAWRDWITLSQRTMQGAINSYFVDKQTNVMNVWTWMVADAVAATGTMHLIVRNGYATVGFVNLTDAMGFPVEWYLALRWGLAYEMSNGQPERIVQRCQQNAAMYRQALEGWDTEDAPTQFVPDPQMGYYGQEFQ